MFVLRRSAGWYNFRNIEMLRMGESRKGRTLNIFKYKDAVKWIDTVCVFHSPSMRFFVLDCVPILIPVIILISLKVSFVNRKFITKMSGQIRSVITNMVIAKLIAKI